MGCIRLGGLHAGALEFGLWLLCVELCRSDVAVLRVLLFGRFMAGNMPKIQYGRHFLAVFQP